MNNQTTLQKAKLAFAAGKITRSDYYSLLLAIAMDAQGKNLTPTKRTARGAAGGELAGTRQTGVQVGSTGVDTLAN